MSYMQACIFSQGLQLVKVHVQPTGYILNQKSLNVLWTRDTKLDSVQKISENQREMLDIDFRILGLA